MMEFRIADTFADSLAKLTANVYTHLGLLDVAGAVQKLPNIGATMDVQRAKKVASSVTPKVTPAADISGQFLANLQETML